MSNCFIKEASTLNTDEILSNFAEAMAADGYALQTCKRYIAVVQDFINWYQYRSNDLFHITTITDTTLNDYYIHLIATLSTRSVNIQVAALRLFGNWLSTQRISTINPTSYLKYLSQQPQLPKYLSELELEALFNMSRKSRHEIRDYTILQILVNTGMAVHECANLKLANIIFLPEELANIEVHSKGKERIIPIDAKTTHVIKEYMSIIHGVNDFDYVNSEEMINKNPYNPLWISQKGGSMQKRAIERRVESVLRQCKLKNLIPDDISIGALRHTFAVRYLQNHPGNMVRLAYLLGIKTRTTLRIYSQAASIIVPGENTDLRTG